MKVELVILGSPSVIFLMVSVDIKQHLKKKKKKKKKTHTSELRSCVKVVIFLMVSVDIKQHLKKKKKKKTHTSEVRSCVKVDVDVLGSLTLTVPTVSVDGNHGIVVTWLVPRNTAAMSAYVLCLPYNHAPVYVTFFKATHVGCMRVYLCLLLPLW